MRVRGPFRSNNLSSLLAAARDGIGIAALPLYVAGTSLAQGRVERMLNEYELPGQDIHAVFPSPKLLPSRVSAFFDHLKGHFARADWYVDEAERPSSAPRPGARKKR